MNPHRKELSKTDRANYTTVLEVLKAHDCITGYKIVGHDVTPEWKDEGVIRARLELAASSKPFGLKRSQRGWLLLVLPQDEQRRIAAGFTHAVKERLDL